MQPAMRPAILLVDDDPTLLSVLVAPPDPRGHGGPDRALRQCGARRARARWPALLIVDLMMPGMDGFELCRRVKRIADLPIIVLSAVDASESKVRALEDYAEDYITKPFDPDELVARIAARPAARLDRARASSGLTAARWRSTWPARTAVTPAGTQSADAHRGAPAAGADRSLDRTVPTETLLDRVWSDSDGADPSYVWVTMRRLRRKLELDPDNPRYLLTERGIGYRLASQRLSRVDLGRPSLRLLLLFGAVAIPPLIGLAALVYFAPTGSPSVGAGHRPAAGRRWRAHLGSGGGGRRSRVIAADLRVDGRARRARRTGRRSRRGEPHGGPAAPGDRARRAQPADRDPGRRGRRRPDQRTRRSRSRATWCGSRGR